ncbi:uncharacterized protein LOC117784403 [Drosophila innubila]|uniref:uncharacterized protein LOC117784403 n=1 Tax=Drosophila innubila TaxID=198719 RepID=UPI00148B769B|nr:uncharacterized protein LOC117784403 [Drosophila innubila]
MENIEEENTITSKIKVLDIGDEEEDIEEYPIEKTGASKFYRDFQADFRKHLSYLLFGTHSPIEFVDDWNLVGRFGASVHKKDNQTRSYSFHYTTDNTTPPGTIIIGPAINKRAAMDLVRKRLSDENWISENEISTPLKAKLDNRYYYRDQYIRQVVSDAIETENSRLLNYLLHLHREYMKDKKL